MFSDHRKTTEEEVVAPSGYFLLPVSGLWLSRQSSGRRHEAGTVARATAGHDSLTAEGHAAASLTLIMVAEVKARRMAARKLRVAGVSVHEDRSAS